LNNESPSIQKISLESNGIGADFNIKITDPFSLYFGYSLLKDYFTTNYFGRGEISANWSAEDLFIKISAFTANNSYKEPGDIYTSSILLMIPDYYSTENCTNINGLAINFKYRIKFLSLENNSSYYTGAHSGLLTRANGLAGIPTIYSKSGIFISDSLFSNNLNMKGGFAFTYYDKINYYTPNNLLPETSPAYILDFTLAGRIRNTATIYFTWENLLDFKYFLIPYYPNLGRNLKFGVAWDLFN